MVGHAYLTLRFAAVAVLATVCLIVTPAGAGIMIEADSFTAPKTIATSGYTTISFNQTFSSAPLVFVMPTNAGNDPSDLRIKNVTTTGFDVAIVEPSNLDGLHGMAMPTAYLAIEPGIAVLPDGTVLEAGSIATTTTVEKFGSGGGYDPITFTSVFGAAPAVLAQIQTTANETLAPPPLKSLPFLSAAVKDVTANGAKLSMERAEVDDGGAVAINETLGYVAVTSRPTHEAFVDDAGATVLIDAFISGAVAKGWGDYSPGGKGTTVPFTQTFLSAPLVVANVASRNGADGAWLRRGTVTASGVALASDEDTWADGERNHSAEQASVVALSNALQLTADELPIGSLRYAASRDASADASWQDIDGVAGFDWAINANSRSNVSDPLTPGISKAYNFTAARGTMASLETLAGNPTNDDASFEIWFKPSDTTGDEILFETGGNGLGTSLAISGSDLLFTTSAGNAATTAQVKFGGLSAGGFTQAVGVIDLGASANVLLYVNGQLVDAAYVAGFTDWAGSDGSGLGRINGTTGGDKTGLLAGFGNYSGQIALLNFYEEALSRQDVLNLYRSVAIPEPATLTLIALGALGLLRRRRKSR